MSFDAGVIVAGLVFNIGATLLTGCVVWLAARSQKRPPAAT